MSQFAGDDVISIYDTINDGKGFVPKDQEYQPMSRGKMIKWIIIGAAIAIFMILAGIEIVPALFA